MFRDLCYWTKLKLYKIGIEIGDAGILAAMHDRREEEYRRTEEEEMQAWLQEEKEYFASLPHFTDEETVRQKTKRENREQLKATVKPVIQALKKVTDALCVAYQPTMSGIPVQEVKKVATSKYLEHHPTSVRKPLQPCR